MSLSVLLSNFINKERNRFSNKRNNSVAFSFGHIARYHDFLQIILRRYTEVSKFFVENTKHFHEYAKGKNGPVDQQMQSTLEQGRELGDELHLQIESFYIFSKIMLDKTTQAFEHYFGGERDLSLVSHHKLSKDFVEYASKKGLSKPPKELIDSINNLQKRVVDFRDDIITHMNNPRSMKGTMFQYDTGEAWISEHKIYPKEGETQNDGMAPSRLMKILDEYIEKMVSYILHNKEKAKLS